MKRTAHPIFLKFSPDLDRLDNGKQLRDGLSAVVFSDSTLWLAGDETVRLERLSPENSDAYNHHAAFPLRDYLSLPAGAEGEADIEGLDVADGYLWLVGSHSLKRRSPKPGKSSAENRKRLTSVESDGNRFLLARIPISQQGPPQSLAKKTGKRNNRRVAAQLRGSTTGNDLTIALRKDRHFQNFAAIPGKDNGLDIEGLAVAAGRIFVGLRGPVLRGWTTILELAVTEKRLPSILRLREIGAKGRPYRKHFLELGGLGVRDLCIDGNDLLILAGPTMDLDGPVTVFRWRAGATPKEESVVFGDALETVVEVPFGKGTDHAEGMTLLPLDDKGRRSLLILYDAPSNERKKSGKGEATLRADVFELT